MLRDRQSDVPSWMVEYFHCSRCSNWIVGHNVGQCGKAEACISSYVLVSHFWLFLFPTRLPHTKILGSTWLAPSLEHWWWGKWWILISVLWITLTHIANLPRFGMSVRNNHERTSVYRSICLMVPLFTRTNLPGLESCSNCRVGTEQAWGRPWGALE